MESYACVCTTLKVRTKHAGRKATNVIGSLQMLIVLLLTLSTTQKNCKVSVCSHVTLLACTPAFLRKNCKSVSSKQLLRFSIGTTKKLVSFSIIFVSMLLMTATTVPQPSSLKKASLSLKFLICFVKCVLKFIFSNTTLERFADRYEVSLWEANVLLNLQIYLAMQPKLNTLILCWRTIGLRKLENGFLPSAA